MIDGIENRNSHVCEKRSNWVPGRHSPRGELSCAIFTQGAEELFVTLIAGDSTNCLCLL